MAASGQDPAAPCVFGGGGDARDRWDLGAAQELEFGTLPQRCSRIFILDCCWKNDVRCRLLAFRFAAWARRQRCRHWNRAPTLSLRCSGVRVDAGSRRGAFCIGSGSVAHGGCRQRRATPRCTQPLAPEEAHVTDGLPLRREHVRSTVEAAARATGRLFCSRQPCFCHWHWCLGPRAQCVPIFNCPEVEL